MNSDQLPPLHIGTHTATLPIVQGAMGVGISLSGLAAAVANEGGVGVIASVGIGGNEPDFDANYAEANKRALMREILRAKAKSSGIIATNVMVALTDFKTHLQGSVEAGADLVFMGAGLPTRLPDFLPLDDLYSFPTQFVPIVSSGRAAAIILKSWDKHYHYRPPAIVVEGPLAGGHLGFSREQINDPDFALEYLVHDVLEAVRPFEQSSGHAIAVIAAGGIYTGADIDRFMQLGASGVQMATRFITTVECDADIAFKEAHLASRKEDLVIIDSPVGLPGRAIRNSFLDDVALGRNRPCQCKWNCLRPCNAAQAPYCIGQVLLNAQKGQMSEGFAFAGANAYRARRISSVPEVCAALKEEYAAAQSYEFSSSDVMSVTCPS